MAKRPVAVSQEIATFHEAKTAPNRIRIYGCGGCGINLARKLAYGENQPGLATPDIVLADTSRSNLRQAGDNLPVFLLPDVDGSGKIRGENSSPIASSIGDLLLEHGALGFNVVLFSASGGSGSVFGPLIVQELLKREVPVVAVVIGSHESAITASNTFKTLKSLDSITKTTSRPLVMWYSHNSVEAPKSEIDAECVRAVNALRILASGLNDGMDSQDIRNLLRFDLVSRAQPQLAQLEIFAGKDDEAFKAAGVVHPITVASLYTDRESVPIQIGQEYLAEGYIPEEAQLQNCGEIHYVVFIDQLRVIAKTIEGHVKAYEEKAKSRKDSVQFVTGSDVVDETGLIL